jgi:multimeric flavodoxin WrbA
MERDQEAFWETIEGVRSSDGVLWSFPLYVFLVASQYKRFIELIFERGAQDAFRGKFAAALSTSIHFFDHAAHNYIHAICDDLGMKFVGSFSADMFDLLNEVEREKLAVFAEEFFEAIKRMILTSRTYPPLIRQEFRYTPAKAQKKLDAHGKKILILSDSDDRESNLGQMITRFRDCFSSEVEVIYVNQLDIKGGCLGCLQCGYDYTCQYQDKDGFAQFHNSRLGPADVLVFAGTIVDRYLSSKWKQFFDRRFFMTHTPSFTGKQVAFLISGPLSQIPNLRQIMEGYAEWQQANLVDFVTDEGGDSAELDALLENLAERLIRFSDCHYVKPRTFLGVGGMKIFRDDIWGRLRFPFQADHRFYKEQGFYDFPHKDVRARVMNLVLMLLTKIPMVRREIYLKRMREEMIKPHQRVLKKLQ